MRKFDYDRICDFGNDIIVGHLSTLHIEYVGYLLHAVNLLDSK